MYACGLTLELSGGEADRLNELLDLLYGFFEQQVASRSK
jgi:hypothetical protein